jgi:hypothetical protein
MAAPRHHSADDRSRDKWVAVAVEHWSRAVAVEHAARAVAVVEVVMTAHSQLNER